MLYKINNIKLRVMSITLRKYLFYKLYIFYLNINLIPPNLPFQREELSRNSFDTQKFPLFFKEGLGEIRSLT